MLLQRLLRLLGLALPACTNLLEKIASDFVPLWKKLGYLRKVNALAFSSRASSEAIFSAQKSQKASLHVGETLSYLRE